MNPSRRNPNSWKPNRRLTICPLRHAWLPSRSLGGWIWLESQSPWSTGRWTSPRTRLHCLERQSLRLVPSEGPRHPAIRGCGRRWCPWMSCFSMCSLKNSVYQCLWWLGGLCTLGKYRWTFGGRVRLIWLLLQGLLTLFLYIWTKLFFEMFPSFLIRV